LAMIRKMATIIPPVRSNKANGSVAARRPEY
jgi:hypothetical protein